MTSPGIPLSARDWRWIAVLALVAAVSVGVVARYFGAAFPEASIDFRYDRERSRPIAERFAEEQGNALGSYKHAARFESDGIARVYLERTLGVEQANARMKEGVRVWFWRHRWFTPLVEEEVRVDVAPTGEIVSYHRRIPEDRALPEAGAPAPPVELLARLGVDTRDLQLVSTSERRLPKRVQRIYTWESKTIRPGGAPVRHVVTMDGAVLTGYQQRLRVPDDWLRSYRELRSKNQAAGSIDLVFNAILMIAATAVFVLRLRRGDIPVRFLLGIGGAAIVLVGGLALNSIPAQLAWYDTSTSYPAFIAQLVVTSVLQSLGTAMLLIVVCGAGEVLYRERLPRQLAIPKLWTPRALASRRVFLSMLLGYALVPLFMAYQVVFYLGAQKFGAWAPADVPYDDMLNSALPWVAVLFAGFFPAFSEEFLARAFSIPFLQRFLRSRLFAITLAALIWGFGHSMYPNQPFWIRGVEVGLAGIAAGFLMDRTGLLPLLIWHYTIDAVYTATLLFASGNPYYVVSASIASLLFAFPLAAAVFRYVRNRGFVPDDDLSNETIPLAPAPPAQPRGGEAPLPPAIPVSPRKVALALVLALAAAAATVWLRPAAPEDAVDYRIDGERAKEIARTHLGEAPFERVAATPTEGFRSWDATSQREDGGSPGGFDAVAGDYLVQNGMPVSELAGVFRDRIEAATWSVRFFTPQKKEEVYVEVDPRSERVVGAHRALDERRPGPSLEREEALEIARGALPRYGLAADAFVLRDALSFPQPARRDWLFHFEEPEPLVASAHRRVTVRVAGADVTQVAKTVKIPESVYHETSRQTLTHVVLIVLKIAGVIALLALVITGLVVASRGGRLDWRRPLRWTLFLAPVPIVSFVLQHERLLFRYNTSVAWETFRVSQLTGVVRDAGLQLGVAFLALAGVAAAMPGALRALSREGRVRFGRSAVTGAVTAFAAAVLLGTAWQSLANAVPAAQPVGLSIPIEAGFPLPWLAIALRGVLAAVVVSSAVALYATALRRWAAPITIAAVFCVALDPLVTATQVPWTILRALVVALFAWVVGRHVLGANPLAWPLAVFSAVTLQGAASLLRNQRDDLQTAGALLVLLAAGAMVWCATPQNGAEPAAAPAPTD